MDLLDSIKVYDNTHQHEHEGVSSLGMALGWKPTWPWGADRRVALNLADLKRLVSGDQRTREGREPAAQHSTTITVEEWKVLSSDFCTRCGLLVRVEAIVLCDGENRPLVRCPSEHLEVQR